MAFLLLRALAREAKLLIGLPQRTIRPCGAMQRFC
jgi:hypothetical protein